jgi:hypothetical protein
MADETLAVFTGDIVKSARLGADALDAVLASLAEAADAARAWGGGPGGARFTRFRGDGWQCLAPSPESALRAALFMQANARSLGRGYATRVSVGIGAGTVPSATSLASAGGPAFEASGGGLDGMERQARLAVAWSQPVPCARSVAVAFALADQISRGWTARQAAVLMHALPPASPSQEVMAGKLHIKQQVVARHLAAAGHWALQRAVEAMEHPE